MSLQIIQISASFALNVSKNIICNLCSNVEKTKLSRLPRINTPLGIGGDFKGPCAPNSRNDLKYT